MGQLTQAARSFARPARSLTWGGGRGFWANGWAGRRARSSSSSSSSSSSTFGRHEIKEEEEEPFYGHPRPMEPEEEDEHLVGMAGSGRGGGDVKDDDGSAGTTALGRARLLLRHSAIALRDPTRADAVAAVGELTGPVALRALLEHMRADPSGRRILRERPLVSKDTIPYDALIAGAATGTPRLSSRSDTVTFGQAYGAYLATHGFDPDGRDPVRFVDDPDLAYVMLRYRQCHDYWHALTGLPPTVAGELGLKWLELFQTGLPLPALSSAVASFVQLGPGHRGVVWDVYLPWAYRTSKRMKFGSLLTVYYEEEFDTPLDELRTRLKVLAAPKAAAEVC